MILTKKKEIAVGKTFLKFALKNFSLNFTLSALCEAAKMLIRKPIAYCFEEPEANLTKERLTEVQSQFYM